MKRFLQIAVAILMIGANVTPAHGQAAYVNNQFKFSVPGSPALIYTKLDTTTASGSAVTDTLKVSVSGFMRSVTFQANVTKISGTVGGTIIVYGSADGGLNFLQLTSITVTNTAGLVPYQYLLTGNAYTHYWFVRTTAATESSSWIGYLLLRP
ncbi:MAG: hypothetical protein H0X33_14510 [Taibaiella sp.]|nr:hypothetical protein [Taibaiella sp.]